MLVTFVRPGGEIFTFDDPDVDDSENVVMTDADGNRYRKTADQKRVVVSRPNGAIDSRGNEATAKWRFSGLGWLAFYLFFAPFTSGLFCSVGRGRGLRWLSPSRTMR